MLTISRPLSAGQAATYYEQAFSNARQEYYADGETVIGRWDGQLRETFGLPVEVTAEHFTRLANGRHPILDTPLIRRRHVHRAGWDLTLAAPKSVSLVALVAGQEAVRRAHREAVAVALRALEAYTQARMGGTRVPETSGRWIVATFEHDSARPVEGYAAPHLHSHNVLMNVTTTATGNFRALQPRELFRSQRFATAVYRSELAARLQALGYAVERGRYDQPEIVGFPAAYLEAASPRTRQILDLIAREGRQGDAAEAIAQKQTRASKAAVLSRDEVQAAHRAMAQAFGDAPDQAVEAARRRGPIPAVGRAADAVDYARDRQFERTAVASERALVTDALRHGLGAVRMPAVVRELARRVDRGEFLSRPKALGTVSPLWTIPAMVAAEQAVIAAMQEGQGRVEPIRSRREGYEGFSADQRAAIGHVLNSRDRILAMDGIAGSGKTTALRAVQRAAAARYDVVGVAPTSRAAARLAEAGMPTQTLQRFLADPPANQRPTLLVLDEASLASTRHVLALFERMRTDDRVLMVGDVRQHEPVEAGAPFRQLQDHGLDAARLTTIRRQTDPRLRAVVAELAHGRTGPALDLLEQEGRIHVEPDVRARIRAITAAAVEQPMSLVVCPDNQTRAVINVLAHRAQQERGAVEQAEQMVRVLVPRQDMTAVDRATSSMYAVGDIVRFRKGSSTRKIPARAVGEVTAIGPAAVTVAIGTRSVTYDPAHLTGGSVYRAEDRAFSVGERVQFTAPDRSLRVANRQLATIERMDAARILVRLDTGHTVALETRNPVHLDYGYAMTSYSAQGLTTDRVLVHIDADHAAEVLVNQRLAYVALSRGTTMDVFTDDAVALRRAVAREISHPVAMRHSDIARIPA